MPQIAVPSASTIVKTAALIMAVPTLLLPMKAAAQQMALGGPNFAACEQIKDPAKSAQCTHDAVMDNLRQRNEAALARIREADAKSAAALVEGGCVDRIKAEIAAGRISADAVREKLNGRKTREVGACNLLGMLTRS